MSDSRPSNPAVISADAGVCRIEGVLDFTTAPAALGAVVSHIRQNSQLEINMSGVSDSNSVGLALMMEWLAEARRENHSVTFSHIPNSLRQLAGVCQVDGLI